MTNDTTANYFFRNQGGFRFTEEALTAGLAASAGGGYMAGMGIACGDIDGDGLPDVAVTNFYGESTTLYHNHGDGIFSDRSVTTGLAAATRYMLGFGIIALDANNDGRLDLAQVNGHINDYRPATPYAMPPQLFLGTERGKLIDVSSAAGAPWQVAARQPWAGGGRPGQRRPAGPAGPCREPADGVPAQRDVRRPLRRLPPRRRGLQS